MFLTGGSNDSFMLSVTFKTFGIFMTLVSPFMLDDWLSAVTRAIAVIFPSVVSLSSRGPFVWLVETDLVDSSPNGFWCSAIVDSKEKLTKI